MSQSPYSNLPDHQFWRRAVAGIEPFLFDPVVSTRFSIAKNERVATSGSCFAQHISNRLARIGFNYFITEPGSECSMAIWNASRSDMRACALSMSTLTVLRSSPRT